MSNEQQILNEFGKLLEQADARYHAAKSDALGHWYDYQNAINFVWLNAHRSKNPDNVKRAAITAARHRIARIR